MGWNRRMELKHTAGKRGKWAVGIGMKCNLWNEKSIPAAAGCWGGCMEWKCNVVEVLRDEKPERNGTEKECICRKHMINQYFMF